MILWSAFNGRHLSLRNNSEIHIYATRKKKEAYFPRWNTFICPDLVWNWNVREAENILSSLLYNLLLHAGFIVKVEFLLVFVCGIWTGNHWVTCI